MTNHADDNVSGASGNEGRRPIGEVLPGMEIYPLDEGAASFAFLLIKNDQDNWEFRATSEPNDYELLGVLRLVGRLIEDDLAVDWGIGLGDGEDDDGDDSDDRAEA